MDLSDTDLRGRTVIAADGNAIGEVSGFVIDPDTWAVEALRVRLRNSAADQVGASRSLFRAGTIDLRVSLVQSIGDAVVLNIPVDALRSVAGAGTQDAAAP